MRPEERADRLERLERTTVQVLLTRSNCRLDPVRVLEAALAGGAGLIQVREPDLADKDLLSWAKLVRDITGAARALLIVNDRPDIAFLSEADGVHVGQDDLPPAVARRIVGACALVGLSTHGRSQVLEAATHPVDYIGVGPLCDTSTKDLKGRGPGLLLESLPAAAVPAFGIGGISVENLRPLLDAGLRRVAVSSSVIASPEPEAVVRRLRAALDSASIGNRC